MLVLLGDRDDRGDDLGRLAGLGRRCLALAMTLFLLSLAGIPPHLSMYFREPEQAPPEFRSGATGLAIGLAALGTVLLGIFPRLCLKTLQGRRITSALSDEKGIFLAPVSANYSRIRRFQTEPSWWLRLISTGQQLFAGL